MGAREATNDERANRMANLLEHLQSERAVIAAELRPPRAELEAAASMDAWIDTYHAVSRLTSGGTYVFLTDSAVGSKEAVIGCEPGSRSAA